MDQKSVYGGHVRGSSAPAMAEAALPAMNKPPRAATACRTRPNASHFASGNSALTTRAAGLPCPSPSSEIDVVDMADQDRSTSQALAAKKRKRNSTEDKTITTATTGEPKEDYIHVRAQRGQATNSHSLAERVRREKISQRMKFLQELVPGCSKVTGKAVMLDEIINYVQSLQRQVEFLSMKLAAVNPRMDSTSTDHDQALLSEDQRVLRSAIGFSPADLLHAKVLPSQQAFGRAMSVRLDSVPNAWEEQLQSAMQMACFGKDFDQQPRTQRGME